MKKYRVTVGTIRTCRFHPIYTLIWRDVENTKEAFQKMCEWLKSRDNEEVNPKYINEYAFEIKEYEEEDTWFENVISEIIYLNDGSVFSEEDALAPLKKDNGKFQFKTKAAFERFLIYKCQKEYESLEEMLLMESSEERNKRIIGRLEEEGYDLDDLIADGSNYKIGNYKK